MPLRHNASQWEADRTAALIAHPPAPPVPPVPPPPPPPLIPVPPADPHHPPADPRFADLKAHVRFHGIKKTDRQLLDVLRHFGDLDKRYHHTAEQTITHMEIPGMTATFKTIQPIRRRLIVIDDLLIATAVMPYATRDDRSGHTNVSPANYVSAALVTGRRADEHQREVDRVERDNSIFGILQFPVPEDQIPLTANVHRFLEAVVPRGTRVADALPTNWPEPLYETVTAANAAGETLDSDHALDAIVQDRCRGTNTIIRLDGI